MASSFNSLIVDGSTSTNDTVIALASGLGATPSLDALTDALSKACSSLAEQMAADAEAHDRRSLRIVVSGAASDHGGGELHAAWPEASL